MNIVESLKEKKKTVSIMESCTGGGLANYITNFDGASEVFSYAIVAYSDEIKIKAGVKPETIEKYSVYSQEVAQEMSQVIANNNASDFGIGITGKLDKDRTNMVYISVYDRKQNRYQTASLTLEPYSRAEMKQGVILLTMKLLKKFL